MAVWCAGAERSLRCVSVACHVSVSPTRNSDGEVTTGEGYRGQAWVSEGM
jgi:hypothetical protein